MPDSRPIVVTFEPPARVVSSAEAAAREARTVTGIAVATVAIVTSGPAVAAQVARSGFTLDLIGCQLIDETKEWSSNPFQRSLGDGIVRHYAGPALYNCLFVGLAIAAQVAVAYLLSLLNDEPLQASMATIRSPSLIAFVLQLLADATASSAVVAVLFGDVLQRIVGAAAIVALAIALGFVIYRFVFNFQGTLIRDDDIDFANGSSDAVRIQLAAADRARRGLPPEKSPDAIAVPLSVHGRLHRLVFGEYHWHDTTTLTPGQLMRANDYRAQLIEGSCVLRYIFCRATLRRLREQTQDQSPDLVRLLDSAEGNTVRSAGNPRHIGFCKRNKMFFDEYNCRIPWFFVVEFAITVTLGLLDGMKFGTGKCGVVGVVFLAIIGCYMLAIVTLRPHLAPYEFAFAFVATALQLGSGVMFVVGWYADNHDVFSYSPLLVEVGMYFLLAKVALDLLLTGTKITLRIRAYRNRGSHRWPVPVEPTETLAPLLVRPATSDGSDPTTAVAATPWAQMLLTPAPIAPRRLEPEPVEVQVAVEEPRAAGRLDDVEVVDEAPTVVDRFAEAQPPWARSLPPRKRGHIEAPDASFAAELDRSIATLRRPATFGLDVRASEAGRVESDLDFLDRILAANSADDVREILRSKDQRPSGFDL